MKHGYSFSKLCGSVYRGGNLLFNQEGTHLLTAVGNRVTMMNLVDDVSETLPLQHSYSIACMALSKDDRLLITVDRRGNAVILNFQKRVTLASMKFTSKNGVSAVEFSPDGEYLAVAHDNWVSIWKSPRLVVAWKPLSLHLKLKRIHYGSITCLSWSPDSQFLITGSEDRSARIHALHKRRPFKSQTLTGHHGPVLAAFFGSDDMIYTLSQSGFIYKWKVGASAERHAEYGEDGKGLPLLMFGSLAGVGKHKIHIKGFKDEVITSASFGRLGANLLCVGKKSGQFDLFEMPEWRLIHSVTVSRESPLRNCLISPSGDWIAFGSENGTMAVWEWRSETYVLRQQSHHFGMSVVEYSPDGQLIATGGDDGKVKLWNSRSGYCFITLSDHSAPVTGLCFSRSGLVLVSSSLDGTVRVYDLVRYANFRTLTGDTRKSDMLADQPICRFISLAMDDSAEVIFAGTEDPFQIFVWSMRTGRVLDILSGHEGPVCSLSFSNGQLASGSWDRTVRLWDVFKPGSAVEIITTQSESEALDVCHSPDGKEFCVTTLKGHLEFYHSEDGKILRTIDVRRDAMGGRGRADMTRAEKNSALNHFTRVVYAPNGEYLLTAGKNTKYLAIYHCRTGVLLSRMMTSKNKELAGVMDNPTLSIAGLTQGLGFDDSRGVRTHDIVKKIGKELPGVEVDTMDLSSRRVSLRIGTKSVAFSPTGLSFAAVTTEGLLVYESRQRRFSRFDPIDLDESITPKSVLLELRSAIEGNVKSKDYLTVTLMALRLNDDWLIAKSLSAVPIELIPVLVAGIPLKYLDKVLRICADELTDSRFLQFYLLFIRALLTTHGAHLKANYSQNSALLAHVIEKCSSLHRHLAGVCDANCSKLDFLTTKTSKVKLTFPDRTEELGKGAVVPTGHFKPLPFSA